jgi:hypothetical protein
MSVFSPSSTKKGPGRRHKQGQRRSFGRGSTNLEFDQYLGSLDGTDGEIAMKLPVIRGVTQAPKRVS